jgi:hypothetical protein
MIKRRNKSLLDVRIISRLIEATKEQERKDAESTAHLTAKNQEGPATDCATLREHDCQENGVHRAAVGGPRLIASHTNGNAARTQVGHNIRKKNLVTMKKKNKV